MIRAVVMVVLIGLLPLGAGTVAWAADEHCSQNHDALGVEMTVVLEVE
ncbi:MAG: hypothetical protein ACT4PN_04165 [Nitrospiraceae bacterium]